MKSKAPSRPYPVVEEVLTFETQWPLAQSSSSNAPRVFSFRFETIKLQQLVIQVSSENHKFLNSVYGYVRIMPHLYTYEKSFS